MAEVANGINNQVGDAWKAKAAAKQAAELAKIPSEWRLGPDYLNDVNELSDANVMSIPGKCGILNTAELEITERFTAISLAKAVQSGAVSASAVAIAFCKRAAIAQQLTNCLTETFFDDAIKRGQFLDNFLAENKRPVGPLHGVPISLKDSFNYVGVSSTLGIISFLNRPVESKNSPLVDILLDLGAILYCKTNIPQSLMSGDSDNNVFGRVRNPHRLNLGAGGSSGGEGALVAMRGSILGIGTDIGGSIREYIYYPTTLPQLIYRSIHDDPSSREELTSASGIPALCNGTYGFKPSVARIPYGGQAFCTRRGSPGFPPVAGPLANTYEDLPFLIQNVIDTKPWNRDSSAMPFPWRSEVANSAPPALRIGYYIQDPAYPIHPPVRRTLEASAKKLASAGLTVVPLAATPSLDVGFELVCASFSLDPSKLVLKHIQAGAEPVIPSLVKTMHTVNRKPEGYTLDDVFDHNVLKSEYKAAWNSVFVDSQLDVILCPGAQNTAVPHDEYGVPPYTALWNVLEYCGVIIPVGVADSSIDSSDLATPDPNRPYNAQAVHGAPTSVQIVARNYHDEELISACRVIDQVLKQS